MRNPDVVSYPSVVVCLLIKSSAEYENPPQNKGNSAMGFQTPPDRRAVVTVTTDGYETTRMLVRTYFGKILGLGLIWSEHFGSKVGFYPDVTSEHHEAYIGDIR